MLKIIGRREITQATLEFDGYVPFVLLLGSGPDAGGSCRWYAREGDQSHFELWLDGETGAIHRAALILVAKGRIKESAGPDSDPTVPTSGRVPVCDLSPWKAADVAKNLDQLEETCPFDLILGPDFASVRFAGAGNPQEWIVGHRARFGIAADQRLCRVDLIGLTAKDLDGIRGALAPNER